MNLADLVGLQLMIGVLGSEITPEIIRLLRETHAGGLIVFRRNFQTAAGFIKFISGLEGALQRKLLVAVDHEGGRVIHLAEGITVFPDNLVLGHTGSEDFARRQGEIEAIELRRLGIDLNLAPALDVLTASFSPNIGIRSYGQDAELVSRLGVARIKAMQAGGLSACGKHFPGQGQSAQDAHLDLPVLATSREEIKKTHLKPFIAAIEAGVDTMMTSHPIYPELDTSRAPATFSKKIVRGLLREKLGFEGVILSDDLEMGALKNLCRIGESACRAIAAGHDMVLVCKSPDTGREVFRSLLTAYEKKRLDRRGLEKSAERIMKLIRKRAAHFAGGEPGAHPGGKTLAQEIARQGIEIGRHCEEARRADEAISEEKPRLLRSLRWLAMTNKKLLIIFPRVSALKEQIFIEEEFQDEKFFFENYLNLRGIHEKEIAVVDISPQGHDIEKLEARALKAGTTIFFCYDAHLFPQTRELLERIQRAARRCVVVLLRDPYDRKWVRADVPCLCLFGFRRAQIEAGLEKIFQIAQGDDVQGMKI